MKASTNSSLIDTDVHKSASANDASLYAAAFRPVDASFLAFFRIGFGLTMLAQMWKYIAPSERGDWFYWADFYYVRPAMLFSYCGFEWVKPLPALWLHYVFVLLAFMSICVAAGLVYRVATVLLCVGYVYVFLLDKALYVNHYYLMCLISFLMCFLPAHRMFSLDARLRPAIRSDTVPTWTLWLLRAQIAIPYFYGGLAKINADWLNGEPIRKWLTAGTMGQGRLQLSAENLELLVDLVCYGGLAYDLLIVPLLLWRRTRLLAYFAVVAFNLANWQLFNIGVFPWLMLVGSALFFPPDWPRRVARRMRTSFPAMENNTATTRSAVVQSVATKRSTRAAAVDARSTASQRWTLSAIGVYLAFQLLWPLRNHLYEGDPAWTGKGDLFAWRMMLYDKSTEMKFFALDPSEAAPAEGQNNLVEIPQAFIDHMLNSHQVFGMERDPDLILQFSHFLAERLAGPEKRSIAIYALVKTSYNTREPQLQIDPQTNLAAVKRTMAGPTPWIMPLSSTPLRRSGEVRPSGAALN